MKKLRSTIFVLTTLACFLSAGIFYFQTGKAQTVTTSISGKFYRLDILATNTQLGVVSILPGVSVNDNGVVAFTGTNSLFTADGINPVRTIRTGSFYDSGAQINNNNFLIARNVIASASQQFLSRFDTNQTNSPATIIAGVNGAGGLNDFTEITTTSFGLNDSGQPVFSAIALGGTDRQLVTGIRPSFSRQNLATTALSIRPAVANNGTVVVRAGNTSASPIRIYNYNLTNPVDIATVSATTFASLGQSPGITDDGAVIVFYGDLTAAGAATLQTTAGPGIFANFDIGGGTRRTVRIARRQVENFFTTNGNLDGVCDAPEQTATPAQCIDGELGLDAAGNPLQFASFEADSRVGVVRQDAAPVGSIEGDVFIVSFIGTPNAASSAPQYFSNQRGLWTVKVDIKRDGANLREKPSRPMSVVQVNDLIGTGNQVTNISVYDPIALAATDAGGAARIQRKPDHRVAFVATTAAGTLVVRGTHIDSDEDGLPDHWETSGVDFNQDGTIDLALNTILPGDGANLAANPNRKDIYVEMDYMQETAGANPHTHQPGRLPNNSGNLAVDPILDTRNAFSNSPIRNPNGSFGSTLHTFAGEAVPEVFALQFLYQIRPNGASDDFDDIKFGSNNGATPGVPCGNGANDGHFGTAAERGNAATCANVLGAKRLVFRYSLFAHRVSFPPTAPDLTSGVAELGGNDFIVSLAVREAGPNNDYEDVANNLVTAFNATLPAPAPAYTFDRIFSDFQSGTFMHELGHTLGRFHGGDDLVNCKPNYLSIMSYTRQFTGRGLATINLPGVAPNSVVLTNRRLDYARSPALLTLNEAALLENAGINGPSGERTVHGRPTTGDSLISAADGQIDWNNNASINPGSIAADVNFVRAGGPQCNASPNQTLQSSDDWGNILYNHFETINFADGSQRRALLDGKDIDLTNTLDIGLGSTDVDNDSVANTSDNCLFAPNLGQSDVNSNGVGDACDAATTTLADLSVKFTNATGSAQINSQFDYQLTVNNAGPNDAQNVIVTDQLPATVSFVSATSSQGSCSGTSMVICNLGTIANNASASITIRVTPTSSGRLDNYADVTSGTSFVDGTGDPNILNNTGSASTAVLNSATTFTISGRIENNSGIGIGGAFVTYTGSSQGTVQTDVNGDYSITVSSGGIYTIIPSKAGFAFSPQSRTVAYISSNQVVNFVGFQMAATIKNADFDGDGRTDISVFRGSDTKWYVLRSSDMGFQAAQWGLSSDKLAPGDYDGDAKTDYAVFRPSDNTWYVMQSATSTLAAAQWGASTDIPVAGDYDGDGKTDFAVWRPGDGTWYVLRSSNQNYIIAAFGQNGDIPLSGDFDGDRKTDFAFFRPNTTPSASDWHVQLSGGGSFVRQFGLFDDKLVPADYDGNGTTDFGVWRPSDGYWYTAPSSELDPGHNFTALPFGQNGDVPVPGDYDGDGKYDRAVFRNGLWIIQNLTNNSASYQNFGFGTDKPIPNIYFPQ